MITLAVFTYNREQRLSQCLQSLNSPFVNEILLFNDDETQDLDILRLQLSPELEKCIKIYNPIDLGYTGREFRKPIYQNKAVEISKNHTILFSDDDGVFSRGAVDAHVNALKDFSFCAGSIVRNRLIKRKSKSILQGTNYSFNKQLFKDIGGYDEAYVKSRGGGDVDFWYRIYNYVKLHKLPVAILTNACQNVTVKSERKRNISEMDPRKYTLYKHGLNLRGPMYKWFPEIRDKSKWMQIIND